MCKVLKVDKSSYYHWVKAGCITKKVDTQLNDLIEVIFIQGRKNYYSKKVLFNDLIAEMSFIFTIRNFNNFTS
jgi:hypothetical protein